MNEVYPVVIIYGISQQSVLTFLQVIQFIFKSLQSRVHSLTFHFCIIFVIIWCDDFFHVELLTIPKVMESRSFPKFCITTKVLKQRIFLYNLESHQLLVNAQWSKSNLLKNIFFNRNTVQFYKWCHEWITKWTLWWKMLMYVIRFQGHQFMHQFWKVK